MFFQKKKTKIDPKLRFQNRQFNQKLHQARSFKRNVRPIPEGGLAKLLNQIGLGGRFAQAMLLLMIFGAIYLVYIPNFLTWRSVTVEGVDGELKVKAQQAINKAVSDAPFWTAQRNLMLLSKDRVEAATLSVLGINQVEEVVKNFNDKSVLVKVSAKQERFLVRDSARVYDVFNDGSFKGQAGLEHNAWESVQNPGMVKIDISGLIPYDFTQNNPQFLFSSEVAGYIIDLQKELLGIPGSPLAYLAFGQQDQPAAPEPQSEPGGEEIVGQPAELEPAQPDADLDAEQPTNAEEAGEGAGEEAGQPAPAEPAAPLETKIPLTAEELVLVLSKGSSNRFFKVFIDRSEPPRAVVLRLNLLLSQTAPDRYNNLSYIDLRLKQRAFVCLLGAACNQ
jgi:hypothetical protein